MNEPLDISTPVETATFEELMRPEDIIDGVMD
jgi:hypothetical protein